MTDKRFVLIRQFFAEVGFQFFFQRVSSGSFVLGEAEAEMACILSFAKR